WQEQSHQSLDASGLWLFQSTAPASAYPVGGGLMNFYAFHPKGWRAELLLLEKGHEMQQIIGVGRQRVGRTPPSTQVPQKASDNGNGLAVIIKQFKGFVMDIVPADMVDSHGSLAPFLTRKHLFLSRTNDLQSYTCP